MLIFKRGHTHINQGDLSEYLDGRLSGTAAARVDRRLAECSTCRQELDTLRSTVSLLRQTPELALPRSFVAVLVSADATGLFTQNLAAQPEVTAQAIKAPPENFQGDGAAGAIEIAVPQAPVAEQAVSAEQGLSVTVTKETEAAQAEAPALRQAAAPAEALAEMPTQDDAPAPAPVAAMAAAEVESAVESKAAPPPPEAALAFAEAEKVAGGESVAPPPEAAGAAAVVEEVAKAEAPPTPTVAALAAPVDESAATQSTPPPPIAEFPAVEQRTEPTPVDQDSPGSIPPPYNAINIWWVLEGLAAVAAVGFLVMWLLRRRAGQ